MVDDEVAASVDALLTLIFTDQHGRLCVPETQVCDAIKSAVRAGRPHSTNYTVECKLLPKLFDLSETVPASPQDIDYRVPHTDAHESAQSISCRLLGDDDEYNTQLHEQWQARMGVQPGCGKDLDALHALTAGRAYHDMSTESSEGSPRRHRL